MPAQVGFLDNLGVGTVDESALAQEQFKQGIASDNAHQRMTSFGQQIGVGAGAVVGGLLGLRQPKEKGVNRFTRGAGEAADTLRDQAAAQASGITVKQLKARRKIRSIGGAGHDGTSQGRMDHLKQVAQVAKKHGDFEVLGNAMRMMGALRKEEEELVKLGLANEDTMEENRRDALEPINAMLDGQRVAGMPHEQDGKSGLIIDGQGFVPWGDRLFQVTLGKTFKSKTQIQNELVSAKELNLIKGALRNGRGAIDRFGRVLDSVQSMVNAGTDQQILGSAGGAAAFVDNKIRSFSGIIDQIIPNLWGDDFERGFTESQLDNPNLKEDLVGRADTFTFGDNDEHTISLPSNIEANSAEAQLYKANIMSLAYMAARIEEPSNRGLSDTDIKNALSRLTADSSNPEVIFRRFQELVLEGANEVNNSIEAYHGVGADHGITDADWDIFFGGLSLIKYRSDLQGFRDKYGGGPVKQEDKVPETPQASDPIAKYLSAPSIVIDPQTGQATSAPTPDEQVQDLDNFMQGLD